MKEKRRISAVAVELTDFSVFYSQDSIANAEADDQEQGQPDRGGEGPDRQGEQGQGRHRHARSAHQELDRLD